MSVVHALYASWSGLGVMICVSVVGGVIGASAFRDQGREGQVSLAIFAACGFGLLWPVVIYTTVSVSLLMVGVWVCTRASGVLKRWIREWRDRHRIPAARVVSFTSNK